MYHGVVHIGTYGIYRMVHDSVKVKLRLNGGEIGKKF